MEIENLKQELELSNKKIKQLESNLIFSELYRRKDAFNHIEDLNYHTKYRNDMQAEINRLKGLISAAWIASRESLAFENGNYDNYEPKYKDLNDFLKKHKINL